MLELLQSVSITQTCMIGIVVGLILYWYTSKRKFNMPPGPLSLPLLGNALQLGSDERYHIKFYEWSKKYGPVITVGFGPIKLVCVNNLETAMEVLVKKSKDFAGRQEMPSVSRWTDGFKDIAFTRYGPTWKLHRKIASKALRHYMQGNSLEKRIHTALQTTFPVLEQKTESFCPEDVVNFLLTNILMGLCFDGKFEYGNKELRHIMEKDDERTREFNNFIPEDMFPFLEHVFTSKAMKKIEGIYKDLIENFIARKYYEEKKTFNKDRVRHFTDTLLLAREEAEREDSSTKEYLTDIHLIQTLSDIFFAGIDTSRYALYFAILHMIAFPEVQKRVQEELERVVGMSRLPGLADWPNLSYTEAVLYESMRLGPVSPCGLLHSTMCDTDIGFKIPKGTLVAVNHWALLHDPQAWDEVEEFKPERFLDENGKLGPLPPNWLPFSAGKRSCLGEFVAKPELLLLFAGLMHRWSWASEPGVRVDIMPKGTLFLAHPSPYKVLVCSRKGSKNNQEAVLGGCESAV